VNFNVNIQNRKAGLGWPKTSSENGLFNKNWVSNASLDDKMWLELSYSNWLGKLMFFASCSYDEITPA